jgi:hypothetical protein
MAGDWIKIEKTTARKPEVLRVAAALGIHPDHAFGLCIRWWCWCDDHLETANAAGVSVVLVDSLVERPGFADALILVGWLRVRDGSLEVPNMDRHLSQTAKKRAVTAARVAKHTAKTNSKANAQTNADGVSEALPEKRRVREEVSSNEETPPKPPEGEPGGAEVSKSKKRKRPIARSTGPAGARVTGIEIDGELVLYDADPLRWEAAFIAWWNALPGVHQRGLLTLDTALRRLLLDRLSEPDWTWKQTAARFPLWTPSQEWVPTLSWFLEPVSVSKIMEGRYEQRAEQAGLFANRQADPTRVRTGKTDAAIDAALAEAAAPFG